MEKTEEKQQTEIIETQNFDKVIQLLSIESPQISMLSHKISIAPMMDVTNIYFRFFMRLLTRKSALYTEMINCNAVLHHVKGPFELLDFHKIEHPVVVQLGGSEPDKLCQAAIICEKMGYDEINLNVGCPSPRVQEGYFGACMMKEPKLVSNIMKQLQQSVKIPCTVKCRLGVDDFDTYDYVKDFINEVSNEGNVTHFIIHSRKALLKGLSPAENRTVPPLKYDWVIQLKKDFPKINFSINGGFKDIKAIQNILEPENQLTGCMIGRAAYENPWILSNVDNAFYGCENPAKNRKEILQIYGDFGDLMLKQNKLQNIPMLVKPIINLFAGEKFSRNYRHFLSDFNNHKKFGGFRGLIDKCVEELESVNKEALYSPPDEERVWENNK